MWGPGDIPYLHPPNCSNTAQHCPTALKDALAQTERDVRTIESAVPFVMADDQSSADDRSSSAWKRDWRAARSDSASFTIAHDCTFASGQNSRGTPHNHINNQHFPGETSPDTTLQGAAFTNADMCTTPQHTRAKRCTAVIIQGALHLPLCLESRRPGHSRCIAHGCHRIGNAESATDCAQMRRTWPTRFP